FYTFVLVLFGLSELVVHALGDLLLRGTIGVFLNSRDAHRVLLPFPTRRSSELRPAARCQGRWPGPGPTQQRPGPGCGRPRPAAQDRKSTRLNSSHVKISYAAFCLKKK